MLLSAAYCLKALEIKCGSPSAPAAAPSAPAADHSVPAPSPLAAPPWSELACVGFVFVSF